MSVAPPRSAQMGLHHLAEVGVVLFLGYVLPEALFQYRVVIEDDLAEGRHAKVPCHWHPLARGTSRAHL